MKIFNNLFLFFIGGFLAGLTSLIFLAIIPIASIKSDYLLITLISLVEEFIKLVSLSFMVMLTTSFSRFKYYIYLAIAFGLSFSLFELSLLLLGNTYFLNYSFLLTTLVHVTTAVILLFALKRGLVKSHNKRINQNQVFAGQELSTRLASLFILAFFIHLCYNLIILKLV